MALKNWQTTAASNATVGSITWAEGMAPSAVNDSARQVMADVATQYAAGEWFWVTVSATGSVASQTVFKVAGNLTTDFHGSRRVRLSGGSSTRYCNIVSSSFTAETTVTVTVDSGSLSASHTIVSVGVPATNSPVPSTSSTPSLPLTAGSGSPLTGDLWLTKATPQINVNAAAAGQEGAVALLTNTSRRWRITKDSTSEAGSDAGSDLLIQSYDDSNVLIGTAIKVTRSNRLTTANAGLVVLGAGVQIGSPTSGDMGVGTLNVDSAIYIDGTSIITLAAGKTALYEHRVSVGTDGGAFMSGSWQDITSLAETDDDDAIGSVSSGVITLAAGTYEVDFQHVAHRCGNFFFRFYDVGNTTQRGLGNPAVSNTGGSGGLNTISAGKTGRFTIASGSTFKLQGYCQTTRSTDGLGLAISLDSQDEVFGSVSIRKIS